MVGRLEKAGLRSLLCARLLGFTGRFLRGRGTSWPGTRQVEMNCLRKKAVKEPVMSVNARTIHDLILETSLLEVGSTHPGGVGHPDKVA